MQGHCFVKSVAQISPQQPLSEEWLNNPVKLEGDYIFSKDPENSDIISLREGRRMGKLLRRAMMTSVTALEKAGISIPEAIITGTGKGSIEQTERILYDIATLGDGSVKPILFMLSTHNTISSQIALKLKCHSYNNTYSHNGLSFENALFDAWLQLKGKIIGNALVGAHDNTTPLVTEIIKSNHPEFSIITETSFSTVLVASNDEANLCEVKDVQLLHKPSFETLSALLNSGEDEVIVMGLNDNERNDSCYYKLLDTLEYKPKIVKYKHRFGDNFSSSAMGFYVGVTLLKEQKIPDFLLSEKISNDSLKLNNITVINHSEGLDWSVIRLTRNNEIKG